MSKHSRRRTPVRLRLRGPAERVRGVPVSWLLLLACGLALGAAIAAKLGWVQ